MGKCISKPVPESDILVKTDNDPKKSIEPVVGSAKPSERSLQHLFSKEVEDKDSALQKISETTLNNSLETIVEGRSPEEDHDEEPKLLLMDAAQELCEAVYEAADMNEAVTEEVEELCLKKVFPEEVALKEVRSPVETLESDVHPVETLNEDAVSVQPTSPITETKAVETSKGNEEIQLFTDPALVEEDAVNETSESTSEVTIQAQVVKPLKENEQAGDGRELGSGNDQGHLLTQGSEKFEIVGIPEVT